jgi:Ca-activated chloride channel homolog
MTTGHLTAWAAAIAMLLPVAAAQPPRFRAETRLVVLHVTVTNGRGQVVTNLDRDAFRVFEDGREQSIALFRHDDVPISLGLLIDNSRSMRPLRPNVEAAAMAFVRASNPMDETFVMNFADTPRIDVPFTTDVRTLEAGIKRVDSIGGTAIRDAIGLADSYLRAHARRDRRALLVITDGNDNASSISRTQLRASLEQDTTVVFGVGLTHVVPSAAERHGDDELEQLATTTGGVMRRATSVSEVNDVVLEMAYQIRHAYTIAYSPRTGSLVGSYRRIRVRVTEPHGLTARTRPGYWDCSSP